MRSSAVDDNGVRRATFVRVLDGDTFEANIITLDVDAEQDIAQRRIRVKGWNAAELREDEGPIMRDEFRRLLQGAQTIVLDPERGGSPKYKRTFERIVAAVYLDGVRFDGLLKAAHRAVRASLQRRR